MFPADYSLAAGTQVSVCSGPNVLGATSIDEQATTLIWTQRHMWNNKGDTAILLDPAGTEVARCSAEIR